jgi:hypothetical protein
MDKLDYCFVLYLGLNTSNAQLVREPTNQRSRENKNKKESKKNNFMRAIQIPSDNVFGLRDNMCVFQIMDE